MKVNRDDFIDFAGELVRKEDIISIGSVDVGDTRSYHGTSSISINVPFKIEKTFDHRQEAEAYRKIFIEKFFE